MLHVGVFAPLQVTSQLLPSHTGTRRYTHHLSLLCKFIKVRPYAASSVLFRINFKAKAPAPALPPPLVATPPDAALDRYSSRGPRMISGPQAVCLRCRGRMRAAAFPRPQQPTCPAKITLETSMHAPLVGAALPRPGTVPATAKARKSDKMGKKRTNCFTIQKYRYLAFQTICCLF